MKYKLLKDLPLDKAGKIIEPYITGVYCGYNCELHPDFFEPIVEKKTYDDLKKNDMIFGIDYDGSVYKSHFEVENCRSETFLTREEAEDEHKRREWACRRDKFIPKEGDRFYTPGWHDDYCKEISYKTFYSNVYEYYQIINNGLAFRTREDCQDAIDNHDLIRLFYQIR